MSKAKNKRYAVSVRLNEKDYKKLLQKADKEKLAIATYIRWALLNDKE